MPPSRHQAITALTLLLGSGCAMDLPLFERIVDVRPLALRVEVDDPTADPEQAVANEALPLNLSNPFDPFTTIRVRPLLVDVDAPLTPERIEAELEPVWLACPLQPLEGTFGCISRQVPLQLEEIEVCPTLTLGDLDPMAMELPQSPVPCRITGGRPAEPSLQLPLDFNFFLGGDLEITMIAHRPDESSTERCAQAVLEREPLPTSCIVGAQRASIGPDSEMLRLAMDFGIDGLDSLGSLPLDAEGNVIEVEPDRHPRIQTFRVVVTDQSVTRTNLEAAFEQGDALDVAAGDTVQVSTGQTLVIETTALEDDLQTYLVPRDADAFEERQENYVGGWYRTWGTLLGNGTDDPRSLNTWVMEPGEQDDVESDRPPEDRATLYYVLHDDRQGVDWWWFHVEVMP